MTLTHVSGEIQMELTKNLTRVTALALGIDGGAGHGRRKQGREQAPRSSTFCGRGH